MMLKPLASRVLIFVLLGPLFGLLAFAAPLALVAFVSGPVSGSAGDAGLSHGRAWCLIVMGAYAVGIVPALFAGVADACVVDRRGNGTTIVGLVSSLLVAFVLLRGRSGGTALTVGFAGAFAAYVCAQICGAISSLKLRY